MAETREGKFATAIKTAEDQTRYLADHPRADAYKAKGSTCGHAFVVMLALLLQRELERLWTNLDITVEEGIGELASIHTQKIRLGDTTVDNIPTPNKIGVQLLKAANISLPSVFPHKPVNVHTKKKLQSERKQM